MSTATPSSNEIGQRYKDTWYKVIDAGPFESRYQQARVRPDGLGWEMYSEQVFTGETARADAERAMTDDLIQAIHGGGW